jgi:hypothetical protein
MVDLGVHAMDLVEFVTGKRFDKIMAVAKNVVHKYDMGTVIQTVGGGG